MEMEFSTVNELFAASVERYHDQVALKLAPPGERRSYHGTTYGELGELAGNFAGVLLELGAEKGDRVAILAKPRLEWAIVLWGALRLGAVVVPIDADLTPLEIGRILEESEAKVLVAAGERLTAIKRGRERPSNLEHSISMDRVDGFSNIWELLEGREPPPPAAVEPEALALIVYTSGTTGNAKGVMLSHRNLVSNTTSAGKQLDVDHRDRALSIVPWYHIFGIAILLVATRAGATLVYTNDYKGIPQLMLRERITILVGVPKLFNAMFQHIEERLTEGRVARTIYRLAPRLAGRKLREKLTGRAFRFLISGGAPLGPRTIRGFRRLGFGVIEGYGLSETAPVLALSTPFNRKAGSVGPPIPGVELKILNPNEEGIGEVVVRGPNVMQGYYRNPERTREVLGSDGWFHTGDLGRLDRDGWLYLLGRKKNVIILESGKNVYPEEVEFELGRIPYVEDILVKRGRRQGKEVVQTLVYPNWDLLREEGAADLGEIKELLWQQIAPRCHDLAPYKRIKSREDIIILSKPFEKTSSQDIKRYLYQEEVGG